MNDISAFMAIGKRFTLDVKYFRECGVPVKTAVFDLPEVDLQSVEFRSAVTSVNEILAMHDHPLVNVLGEVFSRRIETAEYDVQVLYALSVIVLELNRLERV